MVAASKIICDFAASTLNKMRAWLNNLARLLFGIGGSRSAKTPTSDDLNADHCHVTLNIDGLATAFFESIDEVEVDAEADVVAEFYAIDVADDEASVANAVAELFAIDVAEDAADTVVIAKLPETNTDSDDGTCSESSDEEQVDPVEWTELHRLNNSAAAWQVRRQICPNHAELDKTRPVRQMSADLAKHIEDSPILRVLRASNVMIRHLPLEWLTKDAFSELSQLERRAVHHVLSNRPAAWSKEHLELYAERERELIARANKANGGNWVENSKLYPLQDHLAFAAYAHESPGWEY
ncbi:hypothetical protein PHYBOEH_000703 [Phytophthora boehmeriae]|uniref:Uncharacterized protein n=1 Tax=Phytophthora boehmeriae TaxID=109152 RepID=A0A8T1VBV1_9STRA|nr:hypothetical protein PHYBOEH_000703 [Phytophthora boehmeriae]